MIPGAAALSIIFVQIAVEVSRGPEGFEMTGWSYLLAASMLVTIGYETDRRRGREDYGVWLHIAAAVCAVVVLISLFGAEKGFRHLLLPTAIASMTASLFMRRVVWLIVGLGILFSYLTWLAADVFRRAFAFPVILAVVGIAIIIVTVWVQRTYPRLAARVRERRGDRPRFPGGSALLLAPALIAVLVMPSVREQKRWEQRYLRADLQRAHVIKARMDRDAKRAKARAAAQTRTEPQPPEPPQPSQG
jgi:glucan phosphoethanolaminetransferase (alkaline phosphatase superfamily)